MAVFALVLMGVQSSFAQVWVYGGVYEQDGFTPIENATVTFSGIDFSGDTIAYQLVSDSLGYFADSLNAGSYWVWASAEGYQTEYLSDSLEIEEGQLFLGLDFYLHEVFHPVRYVAARQFVNDLVRISWSMYDPLLYEDFESGAFSLFHWDNSLSDHPWVIDTTHAFEGNCCMKSSCEGVENGLSLIEVSVYIPVAGQMSFWSKISSESPWDMGRFYLDGVKKMECSGEEDWTEHRFDITIGEHAFRWTYQKDASTDVGDDCFYVDAIRFLSEDSSKMTPQNERTFQYYDLFRSRFDEAPVMLASHLTDTVFMEVNWGSLPWGQYRWGVSCYYEGNRSHSDTVWSVYLDKDMTTTLEVNATTNVGLSAEGAIVTLSSHDGQGQSYQAVLDANGHLVLPSVYRDEYDMRVHLGGFVDYVADEPISVFAPTQVEVELMEMTLGIDSLYVSSTGWAIWSLSEVQNRDLQYFEIMLDSVLMGITTADYYQFDVSHLVEGDTCLAQVRPVYLSDTCEWRSCQWVYRPCDAFQGSPVGLNWALHGEALLLSWDYPEGDSLLGAMLFKEGEYLGFVEGNTYLDETVQLHGEETYCLRLVYDGEHDGTYYSMSCEECTTAVFPAYCDPPANLEGMTYYEDESDYGALISWGDRPEPIQQWLYYDDGIFKRSLGGDGEPRIFWAIRFDAEELVEYVGTSLKTVSLYDVAAGTYQLWVYVGGETAPRTLVRSQNMALTGTSAWHEESIVPAYEIPDNESIWIVIGQQGVARPAAACQDMGNPDGRWVSLDGETWTDMNTFNMHYTWMLRAYVTNRLGREMRLREEGYTLQHYNLYRSYDNNDYQQIALVSAEEGQVFYEYRDNLADNDNDYVYYRLTALYLSDEGETCESDYAATLEDPMQHFVVIDLSSTGELQPKALHLYPNPSDGWVTIELSGIQRVSVTNVLGRMLLDKTVDANILRLDLSDFESGMYWLRVVTCDGVFAQPFVLSR